MAKGDQPHAFHTSEWHKDKQRPTPACNTCRMDEKPPPNEIAFRQSATSYSRQNGLPFACIALDLLLWALVVYLHFNEGLVHRHFSGIWMIAATSIWCGIVGAATCGTIGITLECTVKLGWGDLAGIQKRYVDMLNKVSIVSMASGAIIGAVLGPMAILGLIALAFANDFIR